METYESYTRTPFRFREVAGRLIVTNEVGDYGVFEPGAIERFIFGTLSDREAQRFRDLSILIEPSATWKIASLMRRVNKTIPPDRKPLSYLIIVPTLRCDLSCSYCQVSRAPLDAVGFDWTDTQLQQFERFLDGIDSDHLKLEFQGGEPSLRPDLLQRIINICLGKFKTADFVVCSNLSRITPEFEAIVARDDTVISTSIDGPLATMTTNRTSSDEVSKRVFDNFEYVVSRYGPEKVSALPTITEAIIDRPRELIDCYINFGFQSIFLRPVNYMGFARKRHFELSNEIDRWNTFYRQALDYIVELNQDHYLEEFYLSLLVRRIFAGLSHGFVDFRSPGRFGEGYCVIDFDGTIYPTDEARMLSRTRHVDLSIGALSSGIDREKAAPLNLHAIHHVDPDCQHCAYMPFCGTDPIDDISRYGRIDIPRHETWFCNRQMMLFDLIFEKVISQDKKWLDVFLRWIFKSTSPPPAYEVFND